MNFADKRFKFILKSFEVLKYELKPLKVQQNVSSIQ